VHGQWPTRTTTTPTPVADTTGRALTGRTQLPGYATRAGTTRQPAPRGQRVGGSLHLITETGWWVSRAGVGPGMEEGVGPDTSQVAKRHPAATTARNVAPVPGGR